MHLQLKYDLPCVTVRISYQELKSIFLTSLWTPGQAVR